MIRKVVFALIGTIVWFNQTIPLFAQGLSPVETKKFILLDTYLPLASQVDEDRLLKYLIRHGDEKSTNRIKRDLLEKEISQSLSDGTALKSIGVDLSRGDVYLRDALTQVFKTLNWSQQQIDDLTFAWASGKPPVGLTPILSDLAQRPDSLSFLVDYLLNTKTSWSKVCANVELVLQGGEPLTPEMLKTNLINDSLISEAQADDLINQATQKDPVGTLRLMRAVVQLLDSTGTVASYLETTGSSPSSWYEQVWQSTEKQVAEETLLLTEYVHRLRDSTFLYDAWRSTMIDALQLNDAHFFGNYYKAASIPGSRFQYTVRAILPNAQGVEIMGAANDQRIKQFGDLLLEEMKKDAKWSDYIMWHLTRPAEALVLTLRVGLPLVLQNSQEATRQLIESLPAFQAGFTDLLLTTPAFNYYGSGEEFRAKATQHLLTPEAISSFGKATGQLISYSDAAWSSFIERPSRGIGVDDDVKARRAVISEAIISDVPTTIVTIRTLQSNDMNLANQFANWLVQNGKSRDPQAVNRWLSEVVRQLNSGQIAGNTEVANFKTWFVQFLQTPEGWDAFVERLLIESDAINYVLRNSMGNYLVQNDKIMWKILRATAASTDQLTLVLLPRLRDYIIRSKLNEKLLTEISQQNQIASQAVFPIWPELLAANSPTILSIIQTVNQGSILGDLYSLFATSLVEVLNRDDIQNILETSMRTLVNQPDNYPRKKIFDEVIRRINSGGIKTQPILQAALENPQVREAWRISFLNQVRILGKGYIVADYLLRHADLQKYWANDLSAVLVKDPNLMEKIINALAYRKVGNSAVVQEDNEPIQAIARIMLEDRIMFEQIIANKTSIFSNPFKQTVGIILGAGTAQAWIP